MTASPTRRASTLSTASVSLMRARTTASASQAGEAVGELDTGDDVLGEVEEVIDGCPAVERGGQVPAGCVVGERERQASMPATPRVSGPRRAASSSLARGS
jgi:hypothetical protein